MANIEMPQLGETVTEGTITRWFKQVGEAVAQDEVLFEVSTDKVDTEVPSPVGGTVAEILVPEGETVDVGTVLAVVGDGVAAPSPAAEAPTPAPAVATPPPAAAAAAASAPEPAAASAAEPPLPPSPQPAPAAAPQPASSNGAMGPGKVLSPVVRRLVNDYGINPDQIEGTGLGGRVSRDDVQRHIEAHGLTPGAAPTTPNYPPPKVQPVENTPQHPPAAEAPSAPPPQPAPAPPPAPAAAPQPAPTPPVPVAAAAPTHNAPVVSPGPRDAVVPLSNIRLRTGEHMVMSKSVAPHTLTAIEVDYENVEHIRREQGGAFKETEGFSLTYLPFISRAAIDALREYPHLNASVGERELVVHNYVNLAVAVDLDFQGLLAPVVRDADGKRMRLLARDIVDLARRARSKQLAPDDLSNGTFTLTNAGSYGTMMQFPIINQPQVAILSTDAVKRKPVVVEDERGNELIAIHSVGVLAMAWDHRAIDGAYAAAFLARVKEILETRDWAAELV